MPDAKITAANVQDNAHLATPTVLLVDDNAVNLKVLEAYLADSGCRFLVARNGKEAVALFRENDIDLILMDIAMPVMDGLEATKRIRTLEKKSGKQTPIIAVTAHIKPADQHLCINSGTNDYLSKPVSKAELSRSIRIWAPHICEDAPEGRADA